MFKKNFNLRKLFTFAIFIFLLFMLIDIFLKRVKKTKSQLLAVKFILIRFGNRTNL